MTKFHRDILENLIYTDINKPPVEGFVRITNKELESERRWYNTWSFVFSKDDKFYRAYYNEGCTEMQEDIDYFNEVEEVECKEVVPVEKTIIVYEFKE